MRRGGRLRQQAEGETLAKLLDQGVELGAVSLRGTPTNTPCGQIAVLVARPDVVTHLLSPRPDTFPGRPTSAQSSRSGGTRRDRKRQPHG